jgi:hypothetical protein
MSLGFYQKAVSVTANVTGTKDDDLYSVPAAGSAIRTITLAPAEQRIGAPVFVQNLSSYLIKIAGSGDSINGSSLVLPQSYARFDSDGSDWYRFGHGAQDNLGVFAFALSSANILAMNGTPVAMIPAPGAGRIIRVLDIMLQMVATATGYANGGAVEFRYTDGSGAKVSADIASAVITAGAGTSYTNVGGLEASLTGVANAALVVTNATAPFITGTGTGKIRIAYRIEDFN